MRRRLANIFVLAVAFVSTRTLDVYGQTAKEDPVKEQIQQHQAQQPQPSQPTHVERTDRSIGKNIEG